MSGELELELFRPQSCFKIQVVGEILECQQTMSRVDLAFLHLPGRGNLGSFGRIGGGNRIGLERRLPSCGENDRGAVDGSFQGELLMPVAFVACGQQSVLAGDRVLAGVTGAVGVPVLRFQGVPGPRPSLGDLIGGIPPARSFELGAAALPLCLVQSPPEKVGAAASGGLPQIPSDPCLQLSLPVGAGEDEDDPYRCDNDAGDVEIDGILGAENEAGEKDAASEEKESIAFVKDGASTAFIVIVAVAITVAGGFQRRVIIPHLDELDHLVFLLVGEDPHVAGEDVINAWMIRSQEEARF